MKIAIASVKDKIDSLVSPTAGRAPYYLIFEDKELTKTIKNPFAVGGGGAGFAVAQMLYNEGVKMVVSGEFGKNMLSSLEEKGIKYKEVKNKPVKDVLEGIE